MQPPPRRVSAFRPDCIRLCAFDWQVGEIDVRETAITADDFSRAERGILLLVRWLKDLCVFFVSSGAGRSPSIGRGETSSRSVVKSAQEEIVRSEIARLHGNLKRSAWHLRRAIEICPEYAEALTRLGTYWRDRGHYNLAGHYFRKAMALNPALARCPAVIHPNSSN
jgi:tetratricopeptide (TPR) repeat protein